MGGAGNGSLPAPHRSSGRGRPAMMTIMAVDPEQRAQPSRQAADEAQQQAVWMRLATEEPEQQREWIRQNSVIYGGLIAWPRWLPRPA